MLFRENLGLLRQHQIDELLLKAHLEREAGLDLIEEYFINQSSLDLITKRAREMLAEHNDPKVIEAIGKNLSECIVVKSQINRESLLGLVRKFVEKMGINLGKSREIVRAEKVIEEISKKVI